MQNSGVIFDIQRFSVHDGPGIRTTFFLAGCPLSCKWCHNPEGLDKKSILMFNSELCIGCKECEKACKNNVHNVLNSHSVNRAQCVSCGSCVEICPANALTLSTKTITTDDILLEAKKDDMFYSTDGGVTFSGGECTKQWEFLISSMKLLKENNINCCVDTCGYTSFDILEKLVPYTNVFLYDIKAYSSSIHKQFTGVDNNLILKNLEKLASYDTKIWIRIPVIPKVNATNDEMLKIADFLTKLANIEKITLMPYHKLGINKYKNMGINYDFDDTIMVKKEELLSYVDIFKRLGLNVEN